MAKQTTCLAVFIILFWCKGFVFAQNVTYQDRVLDTEDSILVIIQQYLLLSANSNIQTRGSSHGNHNEDQTDPAIEDICVVLLGWGH